MISKPLIVFGGIGAGLALMVASANSKAATDPSPGAPRAGGGFGPMRRGTTYHIKITVNPTIQINGDAAMVNAFQADGWEGVASAFDPTGGVLLVATWNGADGATLPALSKSQFFLYTVVAAVP